MLSGFFNSKHKRSNPLTRKSQCSTPGGKRNTKGSKPSVSNLSPKSESELGFLARAGCKTSLLDMDDDTLESLVGQATHLSLGRKGSMGKIVRVPSYERFDALVRSRNRRSSAASEESECSDTSYILGQRRPSRASISPQMVDARLEVRDDAPINRKNSKKRLSNLGDCFSEVDIDDQGMNSTPRAKVKLLRVPSRERFDMMIRERRSSMSN
jgi:hypothetical protein